MFIPTVEIDKRLPSDNRIVLDVGGCGDQFDTLHPSVTHILDINPHEPPSGLNLKLISGDGADLATWDRIAKDVDFCICSHTLEDCLDPFAMLRNMSKHCKQGYIEFPSIAQEVLPQNSLYGSAHHNFFIKILPRADALKFEFTASTRPREEIEKDGSAYILVCLPKNLAFADGIRGYKYKIPPFPRRLLRRKFWRRPYIIKGDNSWTGIFWNRKIDGILVNTFTIPNYKKTLQELCLSSASDPYVFEC